jgi:hypothetical protein
MQVQHNILLSIITLFLTACNSAPTDKAAIPVVNDTFNIVDDTTNIKATFSDSTLTKNDVTKEPGIAIKNKTDYSDKFIAGLKKLSGYKTFQLDNNRMIINGKDTAVFPGIPELQKYFVFTGRKENLAIALTFTRINYTTIDYKIEMVEFGKTNHNESGKADIIPTFFLGSESDESRSGEAYFVTEFIDEKENNCHTYIRIGIENGKRDLSAKIIKNCNGKIMDVTLDNFPTLQEK